jgi:hypothetical protein
MEANADGGPRLLGFLAEHREVAALILKTTVKVVSSLATEQYWSGHAYLLGPRQAMKFNVRPIAEAATESDHELREETARRQSFLDRLGEKLEHHVEQLFERAEAGASKVDADYLRKELHERLQRAPIRFVFSVQLEKDAETTPIENTLVEWKESDSSSIPVAELVLDREIHGDACTSLRFTPGHYHPDHRPLGNMGRGRIFTYEASQKGRHAREDAPAESEFFGK